MQVLTGKSVYKGIVMGPVFVLKKDQVLVKRIEITDADAEIARIGEAIEESKVQLQALYEKALETVGGSNAEIFAVHQMMLEDEGFLESVYNIIRTEMVSAEYAVEVTGDNYADMFESMDDEYMSARAADIRDISDRLVRNLSGNVQETVEDMGPSIVVADDLSPSETIQMDKRKILAFVTVHGSTHSHTAILARMMNIPALVGVPMDLDSIQTGMTAVVDGDRGIVTFEPSQDVVAETISRIHDDQEKRHLLLELKGKENVTLDGKRIDIFANIGSVGDVGYALEHDAGGIGLFRSEFLYLGRDTLPTEEEQFLAYQHVLQTMGDKKVVIRTMDIGADKQVDYLGLEKEDNPALGYRAIRICLSEPEIFRTQLRALFRAGVYGNLSVMYPMITSVEEVEAIRKIADSVKEELEAEGIPFKIPEQGIMVETPAAALISDELAELVDFFSIGTNDLTQCTLAIDRQNAKLDPFYNPHHKAILRMIRMVVDNAHKAGKWVGICGELGADSEMTETFIRMGVDELSVAPAMVLRIRDTVRKLNIN